MTLDRKQRIRERYRETVQELLQNEGDPRVAVYIRSAAPPIEQVTSYELVIREHREYARKRGWNLVAFSTDHGEENGALNKLIDDCRNGEINLVAIKSIRAIGQDLEMVMEIIAAFAARHVDVYFMAEGILMRA